MSSPSDTPSPDVTQTAVETSDQTVSSCLFVRWFSPEGGNTPLRAGDVWGRDMSCQVALSGDQISRRHVQVEKRGMLPTLRDLESRNGLFVNGEKVRERAVAPGDVVRLGEWCGLVHAHGDQGQGFTEIGPGWHGGETLWRATEQARLAGPSDLSIVIQGATGTGKEGLARAIHTWSGRAGPCVAIDCGALSEPLAEGELFGYRKGAFTGAHSARQGHLRSADGGTLFLDEIVNLSLPLQAKLLRVLQQREVLPLGESTPVAVDVRVVCAAQISLPEAVAQGRFRADLQARLQQLTVVLPTLQARREDVVPLFRHFAAQALKKRQTPRLEPKLVEALLCYAWPLNVRELELFARRIAVLAADAPSWKRSLLPELELPAAAASAPNPPQRRDASDPDDAAMLAASLQRHDNNVSAAAKALGIKRSRAYRILAAQPGLKAKRDGRDDRE